MAVIGEEEEARKVQSFRLQILVESCESDWYLLCSPATAKENGFALVASHWPFWMASNFLFASTKLANRFSISETYSLRQLEVLFGNCASTKSLHVFQPGSIWCKLSLRSPHPKHWDFQTRSPWCLARGRQPVPIKRVLEGLLTSHYCFHLRQLPQNTLLANTTSISSISREIYIIWKHSFHLRSWATGEFCRFACSNRFASLGNCFWMSSELKMGLAMLRFNTSCVEYIYLYIYTLILHANSRGVTGCGMFKDSRQISNLFGLVLEICGKLRRQL